jgi:class 3 adenylate cyclase
MCVGSPSELIFFFYERSQGYWDSLLLRAILALLMGTLGLIDWKKTKGILPILYWEFVLFMVFPFQSTMALLHNGAVEYYFTSQCAMFFILGMVTKVWMVPIHLIFGCGFTTVFFFSLHGWDANLFSASIPAHVNALFCGLMSSSIILVLEGYHRKITEAKLKLAKAEDEHLKSIELAKSYEALKAREELIRIYVRPSLVNEIQAGNNPAEFQPVISNLAIMFCDIREFTKLTEVLNPYERLAFLNQYFSMMTHPIALNGGEVDKIMGDCVMGVFPNGAQAVQASIDMRLELQKFNRNMFKENQPMIRNGIGIAKGDVMQGNFGSFEKLDRTVIGEAVNIAARLESKTKMYNLEVIVTEDVIKDLPPESTHYRWIDIVQVKGSSRSLKLYEIYGHQPEEVRNFKDETRELLEKALTIYFQKGFKDASRLFNAMLERVPPHRYLPNDLMDNLLPYYIAHCDAWINDFNGTWEKIEKWEGVHIFYEK